MANTKDRLDELERGLGLITDDLHHMRTDLNDKLRLMEETSNEKHRRLEESNKSMEAMMRRFMETMTRPREVVPPAHVGQQRPDHHLPVGRREDAAPVNHLRHIKLDCPRFDGGDPTEWLS